VAIEECSNCGFEYGDSVYDDDDPHVRYRRILEEYKSRTRNSDNDEYIEPSRPNSDSHSISIYKILEEFKSRTRNGDNDEYIEPSRPSSDSHRIYKIWTREIDTGFNIVTYTCPNCGYGNKVPFDED